MTNKKKKQNNPLLENAEFQLEMRKIESNTERFNSIMANLKVIGITGIIGYFGFRSIESIAGQETFVTILLDFMANKSFADTLKYILIFCLSLWGYTERKLRKKNIKRLGTRASFLEAKIDPNKASSGITETGDTRAGD